MKIIKTKSELGKSLELYRARGISIGFVPTMGSLHLGHISLVDRSRNENGVTVVSIFVNPTQFNDKKDLANYPRTFDEDLDKLSSVGCDFVFAPSVEEMYPEEDTRLFDFGTLGTVMEGACRPGHFNGVAQIVSKLFDAVAPDKVYFGEKDFQQLAIVKRMTDEMNYKVQIVECPSIRETDGLAMSSRNVLLTPVQRKNASVIARTLFECQKKKEEMTLHDLKNWVIQQINETPEFKTEYFDIVDRTTLQSTDLYVPGTLQGCIAVRVGNIRLIDNVDLS